MAYISFPFLSFSTPYAAALAGILLGQGRSDTATINRIESKAKDLGSSGYDKRFGHGRIRADKAAAR